MTRNEIMRKICGPSLEECFENNDIDTARQAIYLSWIGMLCAGFAIGVWSVRMGFIS